MAQERNWDRYRQLYHARLAYLDALLPDEMRRVAEVNALARTLSQRDDFTIEGCLVEMVKLLVKTKEEIMVQYGKLYDATLPPGVRVVLPSPPAAGG